MTNSAKQPSRAVRPRDAATLVLVRNYRDTPCVLMGQRHSTHRFMPDQFVFPGGRVDRADHYAMPATPLDGRVRELLQRSSTARRAQALAMAAIRETFEETGLILGRPMTPPKRASKAWSAFYATGYGPALDALEYVTRAVTPPYRPIRFNARFFLADGTDLVGNLGGSGELVDLDWIPISKAKTLPIPGIQERVLESIEKILAAPDQWRRRNAIPRYRHLYGRRIIDTE